jgi:DNA repair protein RadC
MRMKQITRSQKQSIRHFAGERSVLQIGFAPYASCSYFYSGDDSITPEIPSTLIDDREVVMGTIRDWPAGERPREKLLDHGPQALSDAELLAIFLRTGVSGKTAVDLARDLLQTYGGLRALLEAERTRFCATRGLGIAKYALLQAVLEMARRHLAEQLRRQDPLENPDITRRYLASRLRHLPHEIFACLFLDNRHRVISYEELFRGTIDGASVHPREVVKRALHHNAAAVILAHNHPSGVAEPSRADMQLTRRLIDALALVDIRVLDHFIIGDGDGVSLAERGCL